MCPGIGIKIGKFGLGSSRGASVPTYWKNQSNFYELWTVTGAGSFVGLKRGDILTVTGTGLNAIYAVPDTDAYKTRDTDYVFHKSDGSVSALCDGNRLIAYDFAKIIVKYLDVSPYTIEYIGVLDTGQSVNNKMRDDFHLSIWWDNVESLHGMEKGNRTAQQNVWPDESTVVWDTDALALIARMTVAGETPTDAKKIILNTAFTLGKTKPFWAKCDAIILYASHGSGVDGKSAKMNILADLYNHTDGVAPTFEENRGYTGNGSTMYLKTGIIPSSFGGKYVQDSATIGFYSRTVTPHGGNQVGCSMDAPGHRVYLTAADTDGNTYVRINDAVGWPTVANTDGSGMFIFTRTSGTNINVYRGNVKNSVTINSSGLTPVELCVLTTLTDHSTLSNYSNYQLSLFVIGAKFDDADVADFNTVFVDGYLASIGAKL